MNHHVFGAQLETVRAIIESKKEAEGALLPILHALSEAFGYIPSESVPIIAQELNVSRAEVHGVLSFYPDFKTQPQGKHIVKLCRAEACQARGAVHIAAVIRKSLGVDWHETRADGAVTLEPVYCLGLCSVAPAAMMDEEPFGRLDDESVVEAMLAEIDQ